MNYVESTLLPLLLELISRDDNLCSTVDELTKAVKDLVLTEHIHPFDNLEMAVRFALEVGSNIGLLTFTDDSFLVPFNFRAKKPAPTKKYTSAQGRKAVKRVLAKSRVKSNSKAKACGNKRPRKKLVWEKQAGCKDVRKRAGKNQKAKSKKRI